MPISMNYFDKSELICKCGCGVSAMDSLFLEKLNSIRQSVGQPFIVNSAYRCPDHNSEVSSTGPGGPHTTGRAIDIRADSRLKYAILDEARKCGITRFGVGKTFIHFDDLTEADGFAGRVIWTY